MYGRRSGRLLSFQINVTNLRGYWFSIEAAKRRLILFVLFCMLLEFVLRYEGIDDVHFYNAPYIGLKYIHFFEACYPPDQQERLDGLMKALHALHQAAEKHKLRYWVDYGTLLGCLRDGKLIPWDFDADVGIVKKEYEALPGVKKDLEKAGYEVVETKDCRVFIWVDRRKNLKIDIFQQVFRSSDNFYFRCVISDPFRYHFPARYIEKTELVTCGDGPLRIPQDSWDLIYKWRYPSAKYTALPLNIWCYFTSVRFFMSLLAIIGFIVAPIIAGVVFCCKRL